MSIVLVTGANSGIGFALARRFAIRGDRVIMVCRDPARGKAAYDAIAAVGDVTLCICDLASLAAIRGLAVELRRRFDRIDVLINNAGAAFTQRALTGDGIERTFAVNHLAPFLLTTLVLDLLREAKAARVVAVGADAYPSTLDFDNLQGEKRYNMLGAYFKSKLENMLFTNELARRVRGTNITANSCGPGPVHTNFGYRAGGVLKVAQTMMSWLPIMQTPDEGARTPFYLATAPELAKINGKYFLRCHERRTKPIVNDPEIATRLWHVSETLTM